MGSWTRRIRSLLPFAVRVELKRLERLPRLMLERRSMALRRSGVQELGGYGFVLAAHRTAMRRSGTCDEKLQQGKERNVRLAAGRIDGIVLEPAQVFSYHHAVGRPSRLRGFRRGLELHQGRPSSGVGGGCCQVSNLLYWLGLLAGLRVVERHRHGFDLFPDQGRRVPFGAGATVFYNLADLRLQNPFARPVLLRLGVQGDELVGEARMESDPGISVEVYETGHSIRREGAGWVRENRIRRRIRDREGRVLSDAEVAHNRGLVLYDLEAVTRQEA